MYKLCIFLGIYRTLLQKPEIKYKNNVTNNIVDRYYTTLCLV